MTAPAVLTPPVVVIGAGPIGLAAAAHLLERGLRPLVLEAGPTAGSAVSEWAHVRLFSTWGEVVDPAAEKLLTPPGGAGRQQHLPQRRRLGEALPAAACRHPRRPDPLRSPSHRRLEGRPGPRRGRRPRRTAVRRPGEAHRRPGRKDHRLCGDRCLRHLVPALPAGSSGLPALGEHMASDHVTYRVPDLTDPAVRARYAEKRTAVIGSGASAFTALASLAELARSQNSATTKTVWVLRRGLSGSTYGGGEADQLPARGALGLAAKAAVDEGHAEAVTGFRTEAVERGAEDRLILVAEDGRRLQAVDEVIVLTGFRPDLSFLSEVRLRLDERLQAPVELAPLIDPNQHSCGTVYPHGHRELSHPDSGVYLVGMKSYGRAPTFLAMTGYEQVRSIAAALAGETEAADRVELVLPETGVCGGSGLFDTDGAAEPEKEGCCAPSAPQLVQLSTISPGPATTPGSSCNA